MTSRQTLSTSETKIEALTIQSSAYGVTIPLVGGVNRIAGNLLDYMDFKSNAKVEKERSGKGGGGVETQNTTYSYSVSVLMSVAQGRAAIGTLWKGKTVYTGGWTGSQVLYSSNTWTVPSSGAMTYTLVNSNQLGSPFVVAAGSTWATPLGEGVDYSLAAGVLTILDAKWRGKVLTIGFSYGSTAWSHAGLNSLGISLSFGDSTQSAPSWLTSSNPTHAVNYPGMAYLHAQDYDLGNSASIENHSFEVLGFGAYRYGSTKPDCNPAEFTTWVLLNGIFGASMPSETLEVASWITYCAAANVLLSPALATQMRAGDLLAKMCDLTNAAAVASYDRIRVVPLCDVPVTGNGVTFTPNTTPVYDLNDDYWLDNPPVSVNLKIPSDRYNHYRIQYRDRLNYYNPAIAEAYDDGDIALNGRRSADTLNVDWACVADVARNIGQMKMQRSLNIVRSGSTRLPWAFCLLEPTDLITLFEPLILGETKIPVRITAVTEDEQGTLTIEWEDWPLGTASPTAYVSEVPGGFLHNYNAAPGDVLAPAIFELPAPTAGTTGLAVGVAARGVSALWGGCHVWVSLDGTEYKKAGTISGGSRYGRLAGSVTGASTSFNIDGLSTTDELISGSAADATNLQTICYAGGSTPEFFAYQIATLTGPGTYTLTGLERGAYGSQGALSHFNVPFVRMDDRIARSEPLDPKLIGQTIYIKCTSFNIYGRAQQDLSEVSPYSYALTGKAYGYMPAIGGKAVNLSATSLIFQYPQAGGVNPSSITLTAKRMGGVEGTFTWAVSAGTATLTGTGDTRTLTPANLTTDTATIQISLVSGGVTYIDTLTIGKVREGANGTDGDAPITGYLTNESATVAADNAGNVVSFASAGGSFKVYFGLTDVTSSCTFAVVGGSGVTLSIGSTTGVYTITAMTADTASATFRATFSGNTIDKVYSIAKAVGGANAQILTLSATSQTITTDGDGALFPTSQTITFTAKLQNLTGNATWTCQRYNASGATVGGAVTLGGTGNTRTLTGAQFNPSSGAKYAVVTATRTGKTDTMTVQLVQDGAQGLPGAGGADAPLLVALSTAQTFKFNGAGSPNPTSQTISVVAALQNVSGTATFACTRYNASNTSIGTVTMGGTGNTRTLTETQFGAAAYADVVVTLGSLTDTVRIIRLQDGANGTSPISSDLTNDAQTLPADSSGVVTDFTGAATTLKVYLGTTDDSANGWTYTRANSSGISSTISTNTVTVTAFSSSVDSGYIDVTATKSGFPTQTKRFTISKSKSAPETTGLTPRTYGAFVVQSAPATATAGIKFRTDGSVQRRSNDTGGASYANYSTWYSPTATGVGSGYWIKASKADSADPTPNGISVALDTWYALSTDRTWELVSTSGQGKITRLNILIASDSAGSNVVMAATATISSFSSV